MQTLLIFNVVWEVVDWLFFSSRVEHSWSCCRCRKTLHIYNGGLWQWDSYEQWTDRRINQHRWFQVQSLKYTYNQKISFSPITEGQSFFDISRLRAFQSCELCLSFCLRPNISDGNKSQRPNIRLHKLHKIHEIPKIQLIQWPKRVDSWIHFEELMSLVQEVWILWQSNRHK